MKCTQCGHDLPSKSRFCPECGAAAQASDRSSVAAHSRSGRPQSGSGRDWLIIGGVLAVVTVGYLVFKRPATPPQKPTEIESHSGREIGDMPQAMKALEDLPTDYEALVQTGNKLMDEGNYPVAAECYKRALVQREESVDVRVDYGACLHAMGLGHRAVEEFRRVLKEQPSHAVAHFNLGIVFHDMDQIDSARVYWQKYLSLEPNGRAAESARELLKQTGG